MKIGRSNKSSFSIHNKARLYTENTIKSEGKERPIGPMARLAESMAKSAKNLKESKKLEEGTELGGAMTKKEWLRQRGVSYEKFSRDPEGTIRNYAKQYASDVDRGGHTPVSGNEEEEAYNSMMGELKTIKEAKKAKKNLRKNTIKI